MFLPPECCNISPSLPALLDYAVGNKPQAMGAVTALQQLNKYEKKICNRRIEFSFTSAYGKSNNYSSRLFTTIF